MSSVEVHALLLAVVLTVASPGRHLLVKFIPGPHLAYSATLDGHPVVDESLAGIILDGVNLAEDAAVTGTSRYQVNESYPWRGVHSTAVSHANGLRISLRSKQGVAFHLELRVQDDGFAFRFRVPASSVKKVRTPDEATTFVLPAGATVWYHDLKGHYEGVHVRKNAADVPAGDWAAPPLTYQLADGAGYASITEAALVDYAGMALQAGAAGARVFQAKLGHAHPASYPYTLRYGEAEAARLSHAASYESEIVTPWRVVMAGRDLNTLVNCDIVSNLNPPPNPAIDFSWVKPGRSLWRFLDGGEQSLEGQMEWSRIAAELGFEYNLLEGYWSRWSEAQLKAMVDDARAQGVGIWLWKHSRDLRTPESRAAFWKKCNDSGAVGAKIDFFDHEAREVVALYTTLAKEAAAHRLMVVFHGANKPTGNARTWPNELAREGIYGLEHRGKEDDTWGTHNTTLPFTRFLAGPADYTPVIFSARRRETSWPHQIATAIVFTSPMLIYGASAESILANPAVEMIKSIPSVWDETIVLPDSRIGEVAAYARRRGATWFIAVLNGAQARTIRVPLAFLGAGQYRVMAVGDDPLEAAAVKLDFALRTRGDTIEIALRTGGGFAARLIAASSESTQ